MYGSTTLRCYEETYYINSSPLILPPCASAYPSTLVRHSIMVWADAMSSRHLLALSRSRMFALYPCLAFAIALSSTTRADSVPTLRLRAMRWCARAQVQRGARVDKL